MNLTTNLEGQVSWQKIVSAYAKPDLRKSLWQTINTLIPFFTLFYLSIRSVDISLWLTLPLTILTAGFMVRAFIIFHDCGHGSFFKSQRANDLVGHHDRYSGFHTLLPLETSTCHPSRHQR